MEHAIWWWAGVACAFLIGLAFAIMRWEPKANPGSWIVADGWRGRVGHFLVHLNGKMSGYVDPNLTRKFILEDVKSCRKSLTVLTCDAHGDFWTEDILRAIEAKTVNGVCFKFIVGPDMKNRNLERLAERGLVVLIRLRKNPPCGVRIVDDDSTYIVTNGDTNKLLRYERTYGNIGALDDRNGLVNRVLRELV